MVKYLNLEKAVDCMIDKMPYGTPVRDGTDLYRVSDRLYRLLVRVYPDPRDRKRWFALRLIVHACKDGEWNATGKKPGSADREHIPDRAFIDSEINWHTGDLMTEPGPMSTGLSRHPKRKVAIWTELRFSVPGGANEGKGAELSGPAIIAGGANIHGRPTRKGEIEAAYRDLREDGQIDFDAPKNRLYEPIRKRVREREGTPRLQRGLGNEAIRKAIYPHFEADKNARSTSP